jgi:hypothetical protein
MVYHYGPEKRFLIGRLWKPERCHRQKGALLSKYNFALRRGIVQNLTTVV